MLEYSSETNSWKSPQQLNKDEVIKAVKQRIKELEKIKIKETEKNKFEECENSNNSKGDKMF